MSKQKLAVSTLLAALLTNQTVSTMDTPHLTTAQATVQALFAVVVIEAVVTDTSENPETLKDRKKALLRIQEAKKKQEQKKQNNLTTKHQSFKPQNYNKRWNQNSK